MANAAAATGELVPPKRIPVNGRPIRLRWLQQVIWSFLAANVGALIIAGLYYLVIQVRWHIGSHTYRHAIRDVYEAVLATLFVKSLLANWRKGIWRAPAWYVVLSPVLIVVVAFPIVAAGVALIDHALPWLWHHIFAHRVLHNPAHLPSRLDWFGTYLSGYPWQPVVIGILAGLVVHRVYAPAGNTVQLYFIGRSVDRTRDAIAAGEENPDRHLPRWPWPPVIRERAAWIMTSRQPVPDRTFDIRWAVRLMMITFAALAIYGAYARYWIGKGHAGFG